LPTASRSGVLKTSISIDNGGEFIFDEKLILRKTRQILQESSYIGPSCARVMCTNFSTIDTKKGLV